MDKKPLIGISICAVVLLVLASLSNVVGYQTQNIKNQSSASRGNWLYVGGSGPGNYTKIQDAIDNAQPGDTVFVYDDSSPYLESLRIRKSIHLIGENKTTTIINSSHQDTISCFEYDNILIKNFTLLNCMNYTYTYGVDLSFVKNVTLTDTIIIGCRWGVCLSSCYNCSIINNDIRNGGSGIELYRVYTSTLSGNHLTDNGYGIYLRDAKTNTISNNVFINNGMYLFDYYPNFIVGNTVNGKALLYLENENDITVGNESAGQIILAGCKRITMQNLDLSHATVGVELINTDNCLLTKTILRFNGIGVMFLGSCNNNTISYNYIDFNGYGIFLESPESYFSFKQNKIIGNSIQSNFDGIDLSGGVQNIVRYNLIENNSQGIIIQYSIHDIVSKNVIANNTKYGLIIAFSMLNLISSNNIVKNRVNALFFTSMGTIFFQNYWKPNLGLRPKFIPGIQVGVIGYPYEWVIPIIFPWLKVDWFAARLPHNIPEER